ncbi:1,2-phenylacetyl-CoA epoxidase subunit PaaE [Nocardioides plantarum]|uniref:1,2-phenylacetyl-CoA epoxidase subunit PaaE n=1 Tax=Nocardioides plantarum TaxID=29299 RepID=A0ABV5KIF1_9ACTN|nr:1,2-phenylacetyl-CoA epoxidase subunit PaaE [Nocardioides plantarum]
MVAPARAAFHPLRVREVESLTDDAAAVTFEVPDDLAEAFAFVPGQSLTLRKVVDGVEHRRQYSISAPAGGPPRVGVREIPDGLFSRWLVRDVRAGDEIEVQVPTGRFCPDPAVLQGGRHLCVAAGSGITPMLSVAASVLGAGGHVTLLYGNRTSGSVMFAEELADLKNRFGPQLQLVHVLSREPRDVELFSGRLDEVRLRRLLTTVAPVASYDHVWLCGPHAMIEDARVVLGDLDVPADRVHFELFYVDAPPPELTRVDAEVSGETVAVTIVLDGLSTTAPLPVTQSVLDGASAMRSDLPFACKGGVCGTCRAKVTDGEVDLRRNYALEPAEVDAGFVLTCQSFPLGDAVTVDFDA